MKGGAKGIRVGENKKSLCMLNSEVGGKGEGGEKDRGPWIL